MPQWSSKEKKKVQRTLTYTVVASIHQTGPAQLPASPMSVGLRFPPWPLSPSVPPWLTLLLAVSGVALGSRCPYALPWVLPPSTPPWILPLSTHPWFHPPPTPSWILCLASLPVSNFSLAPHTPPEPPPYLSQGRYCCVLHTVLYVSCHLIT